MLLYSVLHLTGYPLSMDEIRNFRQFGSKTAGHPEREVHLGIETTTGPLGQGFANAVGMAVAERSLAATFNRPGHTIIDHHTYVFLGDGCMMEGISHEVASFAGVQKLGKLIMVYDDNGISIDGKVVGWFGDDTPKRFEAYGWHVLRECGRPGQRCRRGRIRRGARGNRQTLADLREDDHRLGSSQQAGHGRHARRSHGQRRDRRHSAEAWAGLLRRSRYPRIYGPPGTCATRARAWSRSGVRALRHTKPNSRRWPPSSSGA